jgi:PAS domain S-box-containing protein
MPDRAGAPAPERSRVATADVAERRSGSRIPLPATVWPLVVTASGLAAATAVAWLVAGWSSLTAEPLGLWQAVLYAACLIVTESFDVRLPFRDHRYTVSVADAVIVVGLFWLPPAPFVLATALGVAASQVMTEGQTVKRVFNTAHYTLAAGAAALVASAGMAGSSGPAFPRTGLGLGTVPPVTTRWVLVVLAGMTVFFLVGHSLLMLAISLSTRQALGETWRRITPFAAALWAANAANGLVAAVLLEVEPKLLPALAVPVGLSVLANRSWARSRAERERMQALYAAGRALSSQLGDTDAWRAFTEQAAVVLHCDRVAVFLGRPRDAALDVVAGERGPERLAVPRSPALWEHAARTWADRAGWGTAMYVQLETGGRVLGYLAAFGPRMAAEFSGPDRETLQTLATQAAAALRNEDLWQETESERTALRDIVGHSSDGIYTVGPDRRVLSWNPAMADLTGWEEREAIGRSCAELLRARDGKGLDMCAHDCPILVAAADGAEVTRDASILTRDGDARWINYAHAPIMSGDELGGATMKADVVVVRDVTRERRTEEAKADFVSNISHELRSPLTPIKGFLLTLLREDRWFAEAARRDYYKLMLGQAERLEALIEDLLDVTRLETGSGVLDAIPLDAAELATTVVERLRAEEPGRAVELRLPGVAPVARGNWLRVEQVLGHLLSNAVRYAPPEAPIEVTVEGRPGEVLFSVGDTGPGIPVDEQARIFERFHRGGYYLTREPGGAGLGLYLSKRLVEAMGGRIWVTSRLGEGSTFSFALPAVTPSPLELNR